MASPPLPDEYVGVRAAVLGASGFIGRWVARALIARGATVHLAVRDRHAVRRLTPSSVHELDATDGRQVARLVERVRPEIIFNLVGYGVDPAERDEALANLINVRAVEHIVESLGGRRRPRSTWRGLDLVHVGSALEYGKAAGDLAEETKPKPTTVYGRTKLAGTRVVEDAARRLGVRGVTARLFTVYGPGEHPVRLLPTLVSAARESAPIPLTAGEQRRDFAYVEEIAEGLLRVGSARARAGESVNVATGMLTSVREFAERAADVLGVERSRLRFGELPTRGEEMRHAPVRVQRLRELTGWVPAMPIEEGIRRTRDLADAEPD